MRYFTFREQCFAFVIKTVIASRFTSADPILSFYFQASNNFRILRRPYRRWGLGSGRAPSPVNEQQV